ncbi:precorrin-3B synthase [Rhizobium sp. ARZ01]|uniref:precorrin-3B synthase n=1 Tax=Rhizobium sp. ARZ01 TaxID=2769313 RepID=UPI00177F5BD2|nr:precorrin-3B synthase [Rhizobium sp. ARZ01]MBD9374657.1 precorrin-3B synthase [Rhizobium sp. ARZ01]
MATVYAASGIGRGAPTPAAASLRRGACPSIAAPMRTGDGLLVRLRPTRIGLSPSDYMAIARLAAEHGNGLIEVTARGNLQIRGLREETVSKLAAGLAEAGIDLLRGVAVETPPLSGIDPNEIVDAEPFAAAIRAAIAGHLPPLLLAPKLSIVVNGGGRLDLSDIVADIRLDAGRATDGLFWRVSVGGDARSAREVAVLANGDAIGAVLTVIEALHDLGSSARGRDLDANILRQQLRLPTCSGTILDISTPPPPLSPIGRHALGEGVALGIGLAYGQTSAVHLGTLMQGLEALGAREVRLSPHRSLLVLGLAVGMMEPAVALAGREGFWTRADEPGNAIAVCAGASGCAAGHFDTKAAADLLVAQAPDLLDGSLTVHISGCAKGCAHPQAAALTLVGQAGGVALTIDARAGDETVATVTDNALGAAFSRVAAIIQQERQHGEAARQTFERIGASAVAKAYQQGSQ